MQVKTNFRQDTTFVLESHPEGRPVADASSGSTVVVMTARSGSQPTSKERDSNKDAAESAAPPSSSSRRLPQRPADQGSPEQPQAGPKVFQKCHGARVLGMSLPAGLLDAEPGSLSAAGSSATANEDHRKVSCLPTRLDWVSVRVWHCHFLRNPTARSHAITWGTSSRRMYIICTSHHMSYRVRAIIILDHCMLTRLGPAG